MKFLKSGTGFAVLGLLVVAFFSLNQMGVFGNTFIGLTLKTNPSLHDDNLLLHLTFDQKDLDTGSSTATVLDAAGGTTTGMLSGMDAFVANLSNASTSIIHPNCLGYSLCFTSLSAWESARQYDLVAENVVAVARIEGDWTNATDTTAFTIDGWTTGADNYILIYATPEARHSGAWDYDKYVLSSEAGASAMAINEDFVYIDGLQISMSNADNADNYGIEMSSMGVSAEHYISNNIVRRVSGTGSRVNGIKMEGAGTNGTLYAYNNIVYGFDSTNSSCIAADSLAAYFYNNTCLLYTSPSPRDV